MVFSLAGARPRENAVRTLITIGRPTRRREILGAATLLLGAFLLAGCTMADWKGYQLLAMLGGVIVAAWLVDGSGQRYVGAGLAALAVGGGITLGIDLPIAHYEHTVVYGAIGLALVLVSFVNPAAVRASGAFMISVALTALALNRGWVGYDVGWEMAAALALWSALQARRISRSSDGRSPVADVDGPAIDEGRAARVPELTGRP